MIIQETSVLEKYHFLPELHGLRGFAAIAVLLFHWVEFFPGLNMLLASYQLPGHSWINPTLPFAIGWEGVTLFFVLSGYLLTSHLQNKVITLATIRLFYLRRILRIYPAVWLQVVVLLVLALIYPTVYKSLAWHEVLLNALLWVNLPPSFTPMLNSVWWTLPVELFFYISLPLLILFKRKFSLFFCLLCVLIVTFSWRAHIIHRYAGESLANHLIVLDALPGVLTSFGAGFAAASLQHRLLPKHARLLLRLSALAFLALQAVLGINMSTYWQGGALLMVWNTLLALTLAGVVLAVCKSTDGITKRVFSAQPMVWLGELSFGIYLWHYPVMLGLKALWPESAFNALGSALVLIVALVMSLAFAAGSYTWVEKPMIRLGR